MVAKNHCLMKLRDKSKQPVEITERLLETPAEPDERKKHQEKDVALTQMAGALQQLNPEQLQCVTLFYLEKRSYQEISEKTGYTLLQVKSHIQNGKRNLKLMLERSPKNG